MKNTLLLLITIFWLTPNLAQINPQGTAPGIHYHDQKTALIDFPLHESVDNLLEEDNAGISFGVPLRSAYSVPVFADFFSLGEWLTLPDGRNYYQVRIGSADARALIVAFNKFYIPEYAQLFFYSPDKSEVYGGFNSYDNHESMMFSGPLIESDIVIIEYFEPEPDLIKEEPRLEIMELAHFYRESRFNSKNNYIGNSDWCQVNVNCQEGDDWQEQKRGVARIILKNGNSWGWCSGSLVNNTAQDGKPYFLTAMHCGMVASEQDRLLWQFRFNFERPGCEEEGFPIYQSVTGCSLVAIGDISGGSDMQLLRLNKVPPPEFQPYYNGWDRRLTPPEYGVSIHHPAADVKKISTFTTTALNVTNPVVGGFHMGQNSIWNARFQETENGHGITEAGSSGSPLFNQEGLIVGTLTGGNTNCNNNLLGNNLYGKISYHWQSNGTATNQQLKPWLDPLGTGQLTLKGIDVYPIPTVSNLKGSVNQDLTVRLTWDKPAFESTIENWYNNATFYNSLSNGLSERASVFNITQTTGVDTFYISKLSHLFWEQSGFSWGDNNTFTFKVYDHNGDSLIYESPILEALKFNQNHQVVIHELEDYLMVTDSFYVAIKPVDQATGYPSSLAQQVFESTNSYYGSPGSWLPLSSEDYYFELLTSVYGTDNPQIAKSGLIADDPTMTDNSEEIVLGANLSSLISELKSTGLDFGNKVLDLKKYYNIYRDDSLIFSTPNAAILEYTDFYDLEPEKTYTYQISTVYNLNPNNIFSPDIESEKSEGIEVKITLVSVNDITSLEDQIRIYPNPANEFVNIELPRIEKHINLSLFDQNGRLIDTGDFENKENIQYKLTGIQPGIYFLRIMTDQFVSKEKLIIY